MELIEERRKILLDTPHIETVSTNAFKTDMIAPFKKLEVRFEATQSGSGDPSPDNIRPIEGKTELIIRHSGANIWDEEWELGSLNNSTGEKVSSSSSIRSKNFIPVRPNTQYYFPNLDGYVLQYDQNKGYIGILANRNTKPTDATCYYLMFRLSTNYGTVYKNDYSINYPATVTEYEQYKSNTYTTALGQTVYGGTLDVVSGLLTVDMQYLTVSDFSLWGGNGVSGGGLHWVNLPKTYPTALNSNDNICSHAEYLIENAWLASIPAFTTNAGGFPARIYVSSNSFADFQTEYASLQVAYRLETPITYQLTPQQILTLKNNNTLMPEGSINELKYWTHI